MDFTGDKKLSPEKLAAALESGAESVKSIYSELPNYDLIVPALLQGGVEGLKENCKLTPGELRGGQKLNCWIRREGRAEWV